MNSFAKTASVAALSVAMLTAVSVDQSQAASRRVIGGVAAGIVAGAIIAGAAASANARERVYVRDCSEFRRNARYNENIGRNGRAQYWWDRYAECRGE